MAIFPMEKEDFDKIYSLMEASFPKDEYKPYRAQKNLLEKPEYKIFVSRREDKGDIRGFAAVWDFGFAVYIEHLAVSPLHRNGGIGGKILDEVVEIFGRRLCLEVEPPETEMARRRIEFYKRHGFFFNDALFVQPPLAPGQRSIPLHIMTYGKPATARELDRINSVLRRKVYVYG